MVCFDYNKKSWFWPISPIFRTYFDISKHILCILGDYFRFFKRSFRRLSKVFLYFFPNQLALLHDCVVFSNICIFTAVLGEKRNKFKSGTWNFAFWAPYYIRAYLILLGWFTFFFFFFFLSDYKPILIFFKIYFKQLYRILSG